METWHKRLAQALAYRGKTQADLSRITGKKRPSVNGWLTGETKMMEADNAAKVCASLQVNALWLFHKMGPSGMEDADMTNTVSEPKSKYVTEALQEHDEDKRQLNYFYDGMSQGHKEALVMTANGLYSMDNPHDRLAKPFGALPWDGKERRKGVLYGEIDLSGVKENVRKDNRVPKSSDDPRTGRPVTQGKKKTA
jgi:transcriptional regulator with XRE-family HTH domain